MNSEQYAHYLQSRHWIMYRRAKMLKAILHHSQPFKDLVAEEPRFLNLLVEIKLGDRQWCFCIPCEDCGGLFYHYEINVHHLTYERLGHERESDTVVLCETCHAKRHGLQVEADIAAGVSRQLAGVEEF